MTSNAQVTERYAQQAGKPDGRFLRPATTTVHVSRDGRTIYSYGSHFPMAHIMSAGKNTRAWWLVNGDSYSVTTSRHQGDLRSELGRTGLPMIILPFSAIESAGIRKDSIRIISVEPDAWETVTHNAATLDGVPDYVRMHGEHPPQHDWGYWQEDGRFWWTTRIHHLGGSVIRATYRDVVKTDSAKPRGYDWREVNRTRYFVSSFDDQERFGLYFLAELPRKARPKTLAEAITALRPAEVLAADEAGVQVTRQGDVFGIPVEGRPAGKSQRMVYVLGVNHTATEVRVTPDGTFARGFLRHVPRQSWRRPEHRMQKLGDGKQWHRIVRNTVPDGRSWSISGNVD